MASILTTGHVANIRLPPARIATALKPRPAPAPNRWGVLVAVEPLAGGDIPQRSLASGVGHSTPMPPSARPASARSRPCPQIAREPPGRQRTLGSDQLAGKSRPPWATPSLAGARKRPAMDSAKLQHRARPRQTGTIGARATVPSLASATAQSGPGTSRGPRRPPPRHYLWCCAEWQCSYC
jgi:hypothetical protein